MSDDLISRQAAINAIENTECELLPEEWDELTDAIMNLSSVQPEQRWIPCSERLPEDSSPVLITHRGGVSYGWYNGRYFERGANTNHRKLQTVIAWMPLPEPYREEGDK